MALDRFNPFQNPLLLAGLSILGQGPGPGGAAGGVSRGLLQASGIIRENEIANQRLQMQQANLDRQREAADLNRQRFNLEQARMNMALAQQQMEAEQAERQQQALQQVAPGLAEAAGLPPEMGVSLGQAGLLKTVAGAALRPAPKTEVTVEGTPRPVRGHTTVGQFNLTAPPEQQIRGRHPDAPVKLVDGAVDDIGQPSKQVLELNDEAKSVASFTRDLSDMQNLVRTAGPDILVPGSTASRRATQLLSDLILQLRTIEKMGATFTPSEQQLVEDILGNPTSIMGVLRNEETAQLLQNVIDKAALDLANSASVLNYQFTPDRHGNVNDLIANARQRQETFSATQGSKNVDVRPLTADDEAELLRLEEMAERGEI